MVEAVGDVDLLTAAGLLDVLQRELDQGVRVLVLDLDGVRFLAACGITTLLETDRAAQRSGADFRLVGGCRLVRRPLELLGITAGMPLHRDVASALAEPVRTRRRKPQPAAGSPSRWSGTWRPSPWC
ncbi:STAS domain-containing protein [Pseudonocardia kunmingensis]|uniref:Anti-anti-sigma factor n=1 Tax=Pseudonocardia kunmingensis TaxID=630975 RepID=A0A543DVD2_9PSEU|nr:anti-anti-sigma factor [Pseudonocardia kunmingensis]